MPRPRLEDLPVGRSWRVSFNDESWHYKTIGWAERKMKELRAEGNEPTLVTYDRVNLDTPTQRNRGE